MGTSHRGRRNGGGGQGVLAPPNFQHPKSTLFLGEKCPFCLSKKLFAKCKPPVCHIILGHTGIGETFRSTMSNSLYLFTCISYGGFQKAKFITHADSANQNNGNRFIEQYEWTILIGMCITVQIGERGTFTDLQIGERGKQRVKVKHTPFSWGKGIFLNIPVPKCKILPRTGHSKFIEKAQSGQRSTFIPWGNGAFILSHWLGVKMSEVILSELKMSEVKMSEVKMSEVIMSEVKMSEVKMSEIKMSDMSEVIMSEVKMSEVCVLVCYHE